MDYPLIMMAHQNLTLELAERHMIDLINAAMELREGAIGEGSGSDV